MNSAGRHGMLSITPLSPDGLMRGIVPWRGRRQLRCLNCYIITRSVYISAAGVGISRRDVGRAKQLAAFVAYMGFCHFGEPGMNFDVRLGKWKGVP